MAEIRKTFVNSPPLWVSCLQGNTGWVFASLAKGENPNRSSPGGVPAIMYAVSKGHNDILEVFLRVPFMTELLMYHFSGALIQLYSHLIASMGKAESDQKAFKPCPKTFKRSGLLNICGCIWIALEISRHQSKCPNTVQTV